jgi:protein-tyrosine-phosphatase
MAEAIARYDAADVIESHSAGISPLGRIADLTKKTLTINGYTAEGLHSEAMTREACDSADLIINMTGKPREESFWEQKRVEDWMVQDPYGLDAETYQRVFEGIKRRINQLAMWLREKRQRTSVGK